MNTKKYYILLILYSEQRILSIIQAISGFSNNFFFIWQKTTLKLIFQKLQNSQKLYF